MSKGYVKLFFDLLDMLENLSEEEQGQILLGMLTYAIKGEEPNLTGGTLAIWPAIKMEMDREAKREEETAPNETETKPNETEAKPNETKAKPNETKTKPNETKAKPDKTETKPNETKDKPNSTKSYRTESKESQNAQDYDYDYEYFDYDDDKRAYARRADVNKCFKEFIGRPPTPGDVIALVEKAMSCDFEPSVLAFAIEKSAHADNPVLYAREMMNRWDLRDIRTLGDAANAYYSKSCKVEDKGYDDIPF